MVALVVVKLIKVSIPKRVSEALKPDDEIRDTCFTCVSIPKRVSEALKRCAPVCFVLLVLCFNP